MRPVRTLRGITRRAAVLTAALSMLAGFLTATHAAAEPPAPVRFRVMTWNLAGGQYANMSTIASIIRGRNADIVTVQEIHRRVPYDGVDQVRQLADALGWHIVDNVHFGPADEAGPACDPWPGTQAGNAILTRFPIVEKVTKELPHDDNHCQVYRSLAGAKINVNNRYVRVFTSHFTPGDADWQEIIRNQQGAWVANYLTHTGPLLFTGDLNDTPESTVVRRFVDHGFLDTGARFAPYPTIGNVRIDYIFSRAVTVTGGDVISTNASDHRYIYMDMQV